MRSTGHLVFTEQHRRLEREGGGVELHVMIAGGNAVDEEAVASEVMDDARAGRLTVPTGRPTLSHHE